MLFFDNTSENTGKINGILANIKNLRKVYHGKCTEAESYISYNVNGK